MPAGRAFDPRQHEMHDVLGKILLAAGDENLGAGDLVGAVGLLHRLGAHQAEVRAALRLGEIHGAGPLAGHHVRHERLLLLVRAVNQQRCHRTHGQPAVHGERHVGRDQEFVDGLRQRHRQALAAIFHWARQAEPAAVRQLLECFLEPGRRGDAAIIMARAAFEIAGMIERLQDLFGKFCSLIEDRRADIGSRVAKPGKIVVAINLKDVVEKEGHIFHGRFVNRHSTFPS